MDFHCFSSEALFIIRTRSHIFLTVRFSEHRSFTTRAWKRQRSQVHACIAVHTDTRGPRGMVHLKTQKPGLRSSQRETRSYNQLIPADQLKTLKKFHKIYNRIDRLQVIKSVSTGHTTMADTKKES